MEEVQNEQQGINIRIADPIQLKLVMDSFVWLYHYSPTLKDGSVNPESQLQFTERNIKELITSVVKSYKMKEPLNRII